MTLADLIAARVNKGLTIRAAAREIGISHETLRRAEDGERLNVSTRKQIADYYHFTVTDLWPVEPIADKYEGPERRRRAA